MGDGVLVKGGYVLVKPTAAPQWLTGVRGEVLTISDCIMDDLPRPEFWDWFDSAEEAEARQISATTNAQILTVSLRTTDARHLMDEMGGAEQPYSHCSGRRSRSPVTCSDSRSSVRK